MLSCSNQARSGPGFRSRRFLDRTSNSKRKGHQMSVQMVQAKIKAERVSDVQAAAKQMFAALNDAQPQGIRYASSLLPDGETFVALLQVDDGAENPLPGSPRIPGVPGTRRGLACRAAHCSTADGHRLVPVVLRATAESPCADASPRGSARRLTFIRSSAFTGCSGRTCSPRCGGGAADAAEYAREHERRS